MSLKSLIQRLADSLGSSSASDNSISINGSRIHSTGDQSISIINGRVIINGVEQTGAGQKDFGAASGPITTQERKISDFRGLIAGSCFEIAWAPGPQSLVITAQESVLEQIESEVGSDGTLRLGIKGALINPKGGIKVECSSSALTLVELSGGAIGSFHGVGPTETTLSASGSSKLLAEGAAPSAELSASGGASLDASRLSSLKTEIHASGSSIVSAAFEQSARSNSSGSSRVTLAGSGEARLEASGSSRVEHVDGLIEARALVSGAVKASLRLTGSCYVAASGSAHVEHSGSAQVETKTSGAARVTHSGAAPAPRSARPAP